MKLPAMLEHDTSQYDEELQAIMAISTQWGKPAAHRMQLRAPLMKLWEKIGPREDWGFLRSFAAHLIADVQTDPAEELRWDLLSLRVLMPVWENPADPRLYDAARRGLSSIYLSLAGASWKCGRRTDAAEYLRRARIHLAQIPAGDYADSLVAAIDRLARHCDGAG